ncbi:reticulophagy regulator 3 [Esox lucius]|uniref:RETREG1-3/ARL6IP-like N-terminal reticulon-homology domain-containing protein n=1 Tax=Esox lucius TaxID=8010 RepID=A0A3P8YUY1_ESOLU|nr:reticulophagy regulator 3 [Esox lucius]XP_010872855.2 reticulophagy regulator 3 [Esox lucius]XP_012991547.2 reticulophagy regulator 3 [Esox lucius]XP_019906554.2 reticulophagy regulator 3 [Esox lucius]
MAHTGGMGDAPGQFSGNQGSSLGLRSRPSSSERDGQVRHVKSLLQESLSPYEPVLTYLQSLLLWERPFQSVLLYTVVNVVFWFFALTSLRLLFLLSSGLIAVICGDTWKNKIWPEIRVKRPDESENESWGLVQPGVLSVPELCHHIAEAWVSGKAFTSSMVHFKRHNPGKFCLLTCAAFTCLAMVGRYIPGLVLSYSAVLAILLGPLAAYHRVCQHVCVRLEPALQWLDFSVRGYMMSKPIDNQFLRKPIQGAAAADASDSEEELAAFCPTFDDAVMAKELGLTDSEHSDTEVSYMDNGTFNLSRGHTPLTEGSEDLDRHSDNEESFAQDLNDFPSINPDATLMDDDDDSCIGLPSLGHRSGQSAARTTSQLLDVDSHLDSDQDDLDEDLSLGGLPLSSDFLGGELAGIIASNMIQAALAGAMQPHPPAGRRERPHRGRGYAKQSSSELDTDMDGEDFEMLDQSELNQMDPLGGAGRQGEGQGGGSGFLSNLLRKPQ